MTISTHVLDTSSGRPAEGVNATLEHRTESGEWRVIGSGATDVDGRISRLKRPDEEVSTGEFRITFETGEYFEKEGSASFHPRVQIEFRVDDLSDHYHVPLLLSPFGYTTYRGS